MYFNYEIILLMKTKEEILKRYWIDSIDNSETARLCIIDAMSEVESQTREEMFEFMEWYIRNDNHFFGKIQNIDKLLFVNFEEGSKKKYTLEELFDYWKQLNK
jgi:hypothetical protein